MPRINTISLNITTGTGGPGGTTGTPGDVFLGVCGREFRAHRPDLSPPVFLAGSTREFIFGDGANVERPEANDPRQQILLTEDVKRFPIYVRFQPRTPGDEWFLLRAVVSFNNTDDLTWDTDSFLVRGIFLGNPSGFYAHLRRLSS